MQVGAKMQVVELVASMSDICAKLAANGTEIEFIPTMGALHAGHASLIERAGAERSKRAAVAVVVSIFVNPRQFNSQQDFANYPKTRERDLSICRKLQVVDYVFVPNSEELYPNDSEDQDEERFSIRAPLGLAGQLEGKSRPGHFEGMLTIVNKLFNIVRPTRAYFGQKDYQQLVLVSQMVRNFNMNVQICAIETSRDSLGLPLSSRNSRLTEAQLRSASLMYKILLEAREALENVSCCQKRAAAAAAGAGAESINLLETIILSSMVATQCLAGDESLLMKNNGSSDAEKGAAPFQLDYLELRCAKHLRTIHYDHQLGAFDCLTGCVSKRSDEASRLLELDCRLLIAIVVAGVRLLDNIGVTLNRLN